MNCTVHALRMEWLAALESGDFSQCRDALQIEHRYCCLGVACEVAERHGVTVYRMDGALSGQDLTDQSPLIKAAFGFESHMGGYVTYKGMTRPLTELNDEGVSFQTIAGLVREQWLAPGGIWYDDGKKTGT